MQKTNAVFVTFFLLFACLNAGNSWSSRERFDQTLSAISFDQVDLAPLKTFLQRHNANITEDELNAFAAKNLRYIFYQKLNKNRFIVAPEPQRVVDRIAKILSLNLEISALILQGRRLMREPGMTQDKGELVRGVGEAARSLRKEFDSYFVETHSATYDLKLPRGGDFSHQFLSFLLQSERVNRLLKNRLDEYFFDGTPGAVSLADYGSASISTLLECLELLAEHVGESNLALR